jgi:hypothetical protein
MYSDPTDIRTHEVKIRLSDTEHALLDAYADYTHTQRAAVAREVLMLGLKAIAAGQDLSSHAAVHL